MHRIIFMLIFVIGVLQVRAASIDQIRIGFTTLLSFLLIFILVLWFVSKKSRNEAESDGEAD